MKTIEDVKKFWEEYPLFSGESKFEVGSRDFFLEHRKICMDEIFIGCFNEKLFIPVLTPEAAILDLGCGIGFWTVEFLLRGYRKIYAADLTKRALELTEKRLSYYGLKADLSIQNAEKMTYPDAFFDHVNCQGVLHHTPDAEGALREIARVLKSNGTACISVYHKNIFIRNWHKFLFIGRILHKFNGGMKGRGREDIFLARDAAEITRLYDGCQNPIGKSYSREEIARLTAPFFNIEKTFLYFFPARALPFKVPKYLQRFLAKRGGFMVVMHLRKR